MDEELYEELPAEDIEEDLYEDLPDSAYQAANQQYPFPTPVSPSYNTGGAPPPLPSSAPPTHHSGAPPPLPTGPIPQHRPGEYIPCMIVYMCASMLSTCVGLYNVYMDIV